MVAMYTMATPKDRIKLKPACYGVEALQDAHTGTVIQLAGATLLSLLLLFPFPAFILLPLFPRALLALRGERARCARRSTPLTARHLGLS